MSSDLVILLLYPGLDSNVFNIRCDHKEFAEHYSFRLQDITPPLIICQYQAGHVCFHKNDERSDLPSDTVPVFFPAIVMIHSMSFMENSG